MNGLLMKYFVLKPAGNDAYAAASRAAMWRYAEMIENKNPDLARDLCKWVDEATFAAFAACKPVA